MEKKCEAQYGKTIDPSDALPRVKKEKKRGVEIKNLTGSRKRLNHNSTAGDEGRSN